MGVRLNNCINVLSELFKETKEIPAVDVAEILCKKGFSEATIKRAKENMGIKSKRVGGFGSAGHGVWVWTAKEDE